MKQILIIGSLIVLFNPVSLLYGQCFLVSQLLGGTKSPIEIVRTPAPELPLQAKLEALQSLERE
ncbi:hypothetical protein [Motilimonas sp. 1_MG-2023]|uniref:hypothetical protein n=1 Tax=Motilimonas TaxID=1914248 RepID=UPI0026E26FDD|nr:hypothetical protein [Motilimonas sp. 1_MG-2023]MDO6524854.1 hypothetical protein [Motilimonas sp. 1_MG-2023]